MPKTLHCYINPYTKVMPVKIQLVIKRKIKSTGFKLTSITEFKTEMINTIVGSFQSGNLDN